MKGFQKIALALAIMLPAGQAALLQAPSVASSAAPSASQATPPPAAPARPPIKLPGNLIRLPLTRQATSYTCGISALQSVLAYYGDEFREDDLSRKLKANHREGTAYARIAKFSREHGYHVDIHKDMSLPDLKALLDSKLPVICLVQAWAERPMDYREAWSEGHYVVAVGYNAENIYFMDPSTLGNYAYIPAPEFVDRWHDTDGKEKLRHFGMVVSKEKPQFEPDIARYME
jgi:ABC-type bacteriocin/lantibiotic exporter with double-glycine peptidase domain